MKESTRSGYRAALSHLIGTDCGNTKLCDLTANDIYAWELRLAVTTWEASALGDGNAGLSVVGDPASDGRTATVRLRVTHTVKCGSWARDVLGG